MKVLTVFSLLIVCFTAIEAQTPLQSLIEAEKAFAESSELTNTRSAFLSFLDDSATIFQPNPVNGKAVWKERPANEAKLLWAPQCARISSSGDLGFTTGPWQFKPKAGEAAVSWGHYLSVWGKDENGNWKVLADIGISHKNPELSPSAIEYPSNTTLSESQKTASDVVLIEKNYTEAIIDLYHKELGYYRNNHFPVFGEEALSAIMKEKLQGKTENLFSRTSLTNDFAYTYGKTSVIGTNSEPKPAYYLRIWQKEEGNWKILIEVINEDN